MGWSERFGQVCQFDRVVGLVSLVHRLSASWVELTSLHCYSVPLCFCYRSFPSRSPLVTLADLCLVPCSRHASLQGLRDYSQTEDHRRRSLRLRSRRCALHHVADGELSLPLGALPTPFWPASESRADPLRSVDHPSHLRRRVGASHLWQVPAEDLRRRAGVQFKTRDTS